MLGVEFEVKKVDVDEAYPATLQAHEVPVYLSQLKARHYRDTAMAPGELVITADTVVICRGNVLGKPADEEEARDMLRELSGREHEVVTGVSLCAGGEIHSFSAETKVEFAPLSDDEIDYYVERYRPMDKAGAYGIQEWIGAVGIRSISGSYYNVMGLPVHKLYTALKQL